MLAVKSSWLWSFLFHIFTHGDNLQCLFFIVSVLTYDDSPVEHDGHLVGTPSEDERPDAKMLKSVHGEIPKQSAPIPKEELEESARKWLNQFHST